jgi:hypothetical protein
MAVSGPWSGAVDKFFAGIDPGRPESLFEALPALGQVDLVAMARDVVAGLAQAYVDAAPGERFRLELDRALPTFGHLILARKGNTTISISVRAPAAGAPPRLLSTSGSHEYHRVVRGTVRLTECLRRKEAAHQDIFETAAVRMLGPGEEFERRAGESAVILHAVRPSIIFSVSCAASGDFLTHVDARSGKVLGQSFSQSRDSVVANVLELCAEFPDPLYAEPCLGYLTHRNYKVRLAALKACLVNNARTPEALARMASLDVHPTIARMGKQLLELAA